MTEVTRRTYHSSFHNSTAFLNSAECSPTPNQYFDIYISILQPQPETRPQGRLRKTIPGNLRVLQPRKLLECCQSEILDLRSFQTRRGLKRFTQPASGACQISGDRLFGPSPRCTILQLPETWKTCRARVVGVARDRERRRIYKYASKRFRSSAFGRNRQNNDGACEEHP